MSAFGKRGGIGSGGRPNFGVAKPMKGGPGGGSNAASELDGGEQFPPLEELDPSVEVPIDEDGDDAAPKGAAMDRLTARQNAQRRARKQQGGRLRSLGPPDQGAGASAPARARRPRSRGDAQQGRAGRGIPPDHFRSAHRAQDQPQPARAVRAREGAGRRASRPRPARGAARRSGDQRHHGQRPRADVTSSARASSRSRRSSSATRSICSRSPSASSTRSAAASTRPARCATPASRTAAASTSSSRRCRCAAPPSQFVNSPKSRSRST